MFYRDRVGPVRTASLLAVVALAAIALPAAAADNGNITVTGGSKAKINLTIPDTTADFGSDMTPAGDVSGEAGVVNFVDNGGADPTDGACYQWPGSVKVQSNSQYDLLVSASPDNSKVGFRTTAGTDYATCIAGEAASSAMFPAASPAGAWSVDLAKTSATTTDLWVGVEVLWTDDPSATFADTTLTITAQAG